MKKLLDTLTILTRVVELDRVRAAVKSAHIAMLKTIFRPKKVPRSARFTYVLSSARPRKEAMFEAKVDVKVVVVLAHRLAESHTACAPSQYSFANTPLMAAQVPDATASTIHKGCLLIHCIVPFD